MFNLEISQTRAKYVRPLVCSFVVCILLSVATAQADAQVHTATSAGVGQSAEATSALILPSSSMSAANAQEIQKINENMTVLSAQLGQLELKAKIAAKQHELDQSVDDDFSSFGHKKGNPSVVSVSGLKGHLEAVLVFPGGVTQRVKAGDVIDDRRVSRVSIDEVVLTDLKGGKVQRLGFGTTATIREVASPSQSNMSGMPYPGRIMPPVPSAR